VQGQSGEGKNWRVAFACSGGFQPAVGLPDGGATREQERRKKTSLAFPQLNVIPIAKEKRNI